MHKCVPRDLIKDKIEEVLYDALEDVYDSLEDVSKILF